MTTQSADMATNLHDIAHWATSRGDSVALVLHHQGKPVLRLGPCDRPGPVNSVRKSLLGALYGVAVRQGDIDTNLTLRATGFDEMPGLTEHERQATLWQLLCARSGIYLPTPKQPGDTADYPPLRSRPGQRHWLHDPRPLRGAFEPGSKWFYNNWDFNVAGLLFEQLTGKSVFLAFDRLIAQPMGLKHFDPFEHGNYLYRDDYLGASIRAPYYQFSMTADDLAAFGQLCLDQGEFKGQSLVPAEWLKSITQPISTTGLKGMFSHYGGMWWVAPSSNGRHAFTAFGARGHFIGVLPDVDAVIVIHCLEADAAPLVTEDDYEDVVSLIRRTFTR
ncbi:Amide hydrolase [Bordetella tumbae]|uniref:serine hydrolase domain-containing protein n=1 Tax=Bordetella tumbae TaxID=1649139 RepID=UPI0039EDF4B0